MSTANKLQAILNSKAAIKAAIEAKGVTDVGDVLSTYADKIESITSGGYTGHADVEGLKAIGWTDDDIDYYQKYGVDWDEEDDDYNKVPQSNIDLYGSVTTDNIRDYAQIIVYLPKIDTSGLTSLHSMFNGFTVLKATPKLETSQNKNFSFFLGNCHSLKCVYPIDTSSATDMSYMFSACYS